MIILKIRAKSTSNSSIRRDFIQKEFWESIMNFLQSKSSNSSPWPENSQVISVWVLSHFSDVWLFVTLWTVAREPPLSMGLSRQEYWSGLPFPSPGDLPDPGIKPTLLMSVAVAGGFFTASATWKAHFSKSELSFKNCHPYS